MIRLERIEIKGVSSIGAFSGALDLIPGLQVISARNSYGKSLVATAIVCCFGGETDARASWGPGMFSTRGTRRNRAPRCEGQRSSHRNVAST